MIRVFKADDAALYIGPGDGRCKLLVDPQETGSMDVSLGWIAFPKGGSSGTHVRNVNEVIYVTKGRASVETDEEVYKLNEGDTIFIPAGVAHNHVNVGDGMLEQIWLFAPGGPEQALKNLPKE